MSYRIVSYRIISYRAIFLFRIALHCTRIHTSKYFTNTFSPHNRHHIRTFCQTNPKVLAACRLSARLLEKVVLGYSVSDTLHWAIKLAENKNENKNENTNSSSSLLGGNKEQNSMNTLSFQNQSSSIVLDENEIEFLYAILPIPENIPYIQSNYGSFQTLDPTFQNYSEKSESICCDSSPCKCKYDCQNDTLRSELGSELGIGLGMGLKRSGSKNKMSRNSSDNSNKSNKSNKSNNSSENGLTDPSGALNYYLKNNRNNTQSNEDKNKNSSTGRLVHRRLLCGGECGINGSRSVPFSSAVEQIGLSAKVSSINGGIY